ncbi:RabGAP/TBC [Basidiobolus meristosporus CBS 931.73]|uniref:RabGAP/TBC n=1 Tax=Basidiobolus meristosporus CBS 931.73 TaxID=1314790 RepID=A0A1Y1YSU7_9FUNG|nr:RabGAP/TBC [Basidiobolus meristosporus CBS 931.73]|eukprot:ORY01100.1 RabGAP/TBC [Basidiobolus meristosporus CBS 931.73]
MSTYKERLQQFLEITKPDSGSSSVDVERLQRLSFQGIPDEQGIRPTCWKLLLGYLPPDKSLWSKILSENRICYYNFVRDLIVDPGEEEEAIPTNSDHPLSNAPDSKWNTYFKDNATLEQIDKDVRRTLPDFAFFQQPVTPSAFSPLSPHSSARSTPLSPKRKHLSLVEPIPDRRALFKRLQNINGRSANKRAAKPARKLSINIAVSTSPKAFLERLSSKASEEESCDLHWEVIERLLFIYAKLNPGVGYVQGMNEILGPIYYTMANDPDEESRAHAEADSFFVFTLLMSNIRDHFVRTLDNNTDSGINASMKRMNELLKEMDFELWQNLEDKSIIPTYYAFRWLTVMCTQEFSLPEVIRLWDSILADQDRGNGLEFLIDFCCAMVICIRSEILSASFVNSIKLLQNYPISDIHQVLQKAYELRNIQQRHKEALRMQQETLRRIQEDPNLLNPYGFIPLSPTSSDDEKPTKHKAISYSPGDSEDEDDLVVFKTLPQGTKVLIDSPTTPPHSPTSSVRLSGLLKVVNGHGSKERANHLEEGNLKGDMERDHISSDEPESKGFQFFKSKVNLFNRNPANPGSVASKLGQGGRRFAAFWKERKVN